MAWAFRYPRRAMVLAFPPVRWLSCLISSISLLHALPAQTQASGPEDLLTVAEASDWQRTSTLADVQAFLAGLQALPRADRIAVSSFGRSEEGREMLLVTAADPMPADDAALLASGKLRILVNANIHGGEVEGKEAVQILLREIAMGEHGELLRGAVLLFVPIYNVDGNERIDAGNRRSQNGPDGGVGQRPNAHGLDLNRDFVKADSAECRALLGLFRRFDPQLFLDLHTTNGSHHGYQLTYAPSLSTNVDPALDAFLRQSYLPEVRRATLERHGVRVFDYGNFSRGEPRRWVSYDHRPRFGTNYYGLRNRLSVLSEAYSCLDFGGRVRATRAFVLECLTAAVQRADAIRALCADADARLVAGAEDATFGFDTGYAEAVEREVLVGEVERQELPGGGSRMIALPGFEAERMPVQDAFHSAERIPLPTAWAILDPSDALRERLALHGIEGYRLTAAQLSSVAVFEPTELDRAGRAFQQHHEVRLRGAWREEERELPAGALIVPARQPLARLAAQLLEPRSEDSLSTWNFFEQATRVVAEGVPGAYPVLRIGGGPPAASEQAGLPHRGEDAPE